MCCVICLYDVFMLMVSVVMFSMYISSMLVCVLVCVFCIRLLMLVFVLNSNLLLVVVIYVNGMVCSMFVNRLGNVLGISMLCYRLMWVR